MCSTRGHEDVLAIKLMEAEIAPIVKHHPFVQWHSGMIDISACIKEFSVRSHEVGLNMLHQAKTTDPLRLRLLAAVVRRLMVTPAFRSSVATTRSRAADEVEVTPTIDIRTLTYQNNEDTWTYHEKASESRKGGIAMRISYHCCPATRFRIFPGWEVTDDVAFACGSVHGEVWTGAREVLSVWRSGVFGLAGRWREPSRFQ
nr:hypothetical protein CFP56_13111 [Quercus suber]